MAKYLSKGSQVCVYGEIKNNNYEDSKGVKYGNESARLTALSLLVEGAKDVESR